MQDAFFAYMYRLRFIERWSLMRNVVRENVAEHSFHVAMLAHALGSIAKTVYGRTVPMDLLLPAALFHDATEVLTGDIPTPVKHYNDTILSTFRQLETLAANRLMAMVPEPLTAIYEPLVMAELHLPADVVQLVKAADLLDAYLKCSSELQAGNREFAVAQAEALAALHALNLPEVTYFLQQLGPAFNCSLDELERG